MAESLSACLVPRQFPELVFGDAVYVHSSRRSAAAPGISKKLHWKQAITVVPLKIARCRLLALTMSFKFNLTCRVFGACMLGFCLQDSVTWNIDILAFEKDPQRRSTDATPRATYLPSLLIAQDADLFPEASVSFCSNLLCG